MRALLAVAVLATPAAVAAGDLAFVTAQAANQLAIIDTDTGRTTSVDLPGAPAPVAFDARRGLAFVVAAETGRVTAIDRSGRVAAHADPGPSGFGIAVAPDGGVFLGDWFGNRLRRLDPDLREVWSVPTGRAPTGIAVLDGRVAVAERDDDTVAVFDAASGALIGRAAVGAHPFGLTAHDGRFYSANVEGGSVSVISADARPLARIPVGARPYGIAFAAGRGFVTNQGDATLSVFDAATNRVTDTLDVGDYPEGIATLPGGHIAFVQWFDNRLSILDPQTLRLEAEFDTPDGPRAFGLFTATE